MQVTESKGLNTYTFDPAHSHVNFWVRHMMISKVHGAFPNIGGSVRFDPASPEEAQIDISIDAATLTTRQDQRDAHLKSPDFLDVANYPTITFKSKRIISTAPNELEIVGDLTIRDQTREVTLQTEITTEISNPFGGFKIGASATTKIDREDFGIMWNQALEAGGVLVGKEINIQIELELDRPA